MVANIDDISEDFQDALFPFTAALHAAQGFNVGHRASTAPPFFDAVYPSYLAAVTRVDGDYYLSPLELALVCQCARKNVVIAKHDRLSQSLEYERHVLPDPGAPIAFTSIHVRAGAARARSHFERLEYLP